MAGSGPFPSPGHYNPTEATWFFHGGPTFAPHHGRPAWHFMLIRILLSSALVLGTFLPATAQKADTTIIRYSGQLAGQYSAGGVNRTLFSTSHSATLLRGLHFGAPVTGSFLFGKQEKLLREREWMFNATPYYWKGRFRFYGIGSYERSNLRGINNRFQLGLGPGWAFYADSLGREVAVSNLFIREATYFQGGTERLVSRSSTRLKIVYSYRVFSLNSTTLYQPNLQNAADYRATQLTTLALRFSPRFAITSTYTYTFESRVLEGKPTDNTNVTVGVAFSTK
ncbi:DUF481 domain-containing protein [Hymenobacter cellulosivorans]|uniref:DUF481 domain-containing protein n=1 Tax=Hymenobacter cellulosivorans TaxID=2932249 RepID=A0ABY4F7K7_9BACT|nr:DUF481 domain-containing protein [Hymenobacter cellulosivorans]UOQ52186.1 DUF481 domain-containing protein [Hymenobacter cellulosivorans]